MSKRKKAMKAERKAMHEKTMKVLHWTQMQQREVDRKHRQEVFNYKKRKKNVTPR